MKFYPKPTLNVVVEHAVFVLVLVQQPVGVRVAKVFELDEGVLSESLCTRLHEVVEQTIVFLAADSGPTQSSVEGVV